MKAYLFINSTAGAMSKIKSRNQHKELQIARISTFLHKKNQIENAICFDNYSVMYPISYLIYKKLFKESIVRFVTS